MPFSEHEGIRDVIFSKDGNLILTRTGRVFVCGENRFGCLGMGKSYACNIFKEVPIPLPPEDKVVKIDSDEITVFLTQQGHVFVCGFSDKGSLGLGEGITDAPYPTLLPFPRLTAGDSIIDVQISHRDVIFLSRQGLLFGCGGNDNGTLGLGDTQQRFTPTLVDLPLADDKAKSITLKDWQLFVLTAHGRVFACGGGGIALGLGPGVSNIGKLTEINFLARLHPEDKFQRILYTGSTFFLTQAGRLYVCGNNHRGQLGCASDAQINVGRNRWIQFTSQPQQIQLPLNASDKVVSACVNSHYTSFLLTQQGQLFTAGVPIGNRMLGAPGVSQFTPFVLPGLPEGDRVVKCGTGSEKTYFLTQQRQVYAYGYNHGGALGLGHTEPVDFSQRIPLPRHPLLRTRLTP